MRYARRLPLRHAHVLREKFQMTRIIWKDIKDKVSTLSHISERVIANCAAVLVYTSVNITKPAQNKQT